MRTPLSLLKKPVGYSRVPAYPRCLWILLIAIICSFAAQAQTPPFGVIDTPVNGSTGQAGAINFTGWALSANTVANIALCREVLPGESGINGLLYLGNGVLTPGARPDVARAHPGYPHNDWGWGAQILTNQLPGTSGQALGNGTYKLHAIAADTTAPPATNDSRDCGCTHAYCTDLGITTITADNAHSILPFGTIDTPGQGQTISGTDFVNFAWVLTPQPNIVPFDASTIMVYIDNVAVGHPVYNQFRSDIATLFPGLKNSNGGVGYFHIDTTKLPNGIHNIAWGVTDSANNAQGIGSRAFFVQNGVLSMSFSQGSLTLTPGATATLTLTLAGGQAPAGGITVNLSSTDASKVTVPATVNFTAGASSVPVTITGVAVGPAMIAASSPSIPTNATTNVTVVPPPSIIVPSNTPLSLGASAPFTVTLSSAAPSAVTVNLISSDTSKVTVSPASISIAAGASAPSTQPVVNAVGVGSATITASAIGYTSVTGTVSVASPTLSFPQSSLSVQVGSAGNLTLNLQGGQAPPGGFTVNLMSSDPSTVSVLATATFAGGATTVLVPVMGVKVGGPVAITAAAPGISPAIASVTVISSGPPMTITVGSASVGQGLQAPILMSISPVAPSNGLTLTVTSSDPSKVLVAAQPTDPGTSQVTVSIGQGLTLQRVYAQGLVNSGTVTLTVSAPNYQNGQGAITLTPAGFIMSANGASSFTTSVGAASPTTLTLNAARLSPSLTFAEIQQVRGGTAASVAIGNSNPNAGTVASPVQIGGGADTATAAFMPTTNNANAGTTVLTAQAPPGFATPISGTSVTATVQQAMIICNGGNPATVGNSLQTTVSCTLNGGSAAPGLQVTFTSNDPTKLQFAPLPASSMTCTAAGTGTLTLTTVAPPIGPPVIPIFCVYGLGSSGNIGYSISASGFIPGTGSVTLGPSGVVISGPGGVGATSFFVNMTDTSISVFSALLDGSGNYVGAQAVAGGSSATVNVNSSNPSVGTITTSPLTIAGGSTGATTNFHVPAGASGTTDITVSTAPGFGTPALQFTKVTAHVLLQKFFLSCGGITIGMNLESSCSVSIASPAPSALTVSLTSANPALLLLSSSGTTAGAGTVTVTIPAGFTTATYFAQALGGSGTVTHTASSPGSGISDSDPTPVTLAPSGAVLSGLPFIFTNVGAAPTSVAVALSVLNSDNSSAANFQPLRGGLAPVQVALQSSLPGVGTISSPVTISAGASTATAQFTPVSSGTTIVSVLSPAGFTAASNHTSLTANVSP